MCFTSSKAPLRRLACIAVGCGCRRLALAHEAVDRGDAVTGVQDGMSQETFDRMCQRAVDLSLLALEIARLQMRVE